MKRQAYNIAGKHYKTKTSLLSELRRILYAYAPGESINESDSEILADVLSLHPESKQKTGGGVARFFVRLNPQYGNNRSFWLERVDGSTTDWSFMEAIKPATNLQNVMRAMRWLIKDQITACKRSYFAEPGPYMCPYAGEEIEPSNSHVDHAQPKTFDRLTEEFALHHGINLDAVHVEETGDGDVHQSFADPSIATAWQTYHRNHAVLAVISKRANLSDAKRKVPHDRP